MDRFKNIICVVAENCANEIAIEQAVTLSSINNAELSIIKVIDEIPENTKLLDRTLFPDIVEKLQESHKKNLDDLVKPWRERAKISTQVVCGILFLETIRAVLKKKYDLVIKAAEEDVYLQSIFGSDDMHLSRKCPCPVWLVSPRSDKEIKRIIAAVDIDESGNGGELETRQHLNQTILEVASSLAKMQKAELHIVHVMDNAEEKSIRSVFSVSQEKEIIDYLDEAVQKRRQNLQTILDTELKKLDQDTAANLKVEVHLLDGYPRDEIATLSKRIEADLVVMGTVARTGIPGFLMGNTAETIQNRLDCSVLAIKPNGFVTPVTAED